MNRSSKILGIPCVLAVLASAQASAQITFYEGEDFRGRAFSTDDAVPNFSRHGFNDRASSAVVEHGRWEVCDDAQYRGRCVVLRRGSYDKLSRMALDNRISSVRPVAAGGAYIEAPEPLPSPTYPYRRRPEERVFEVPVSSVHAVVGPPERRCWVEREQAGGARRGEPNVGGAVAGALLGGVLGHQVGRGGGRDVATAGGAVAGALLGSQVGRNGSAEQDVRHCADAPGGPPEYWDVTYYFRGVEHRVQMTAPPAANIIVNEDGEPRQ